MVKEEDIDLGVNIRRPQFPDPIPMSHVIHSQRTNRPWRSHYFWLCVVTSGIAFLGFSFTYFRPMLGGTYPDVSPTVHVHGWTFFLWYLLLPLQAGLIASRRVALHRRLGALSLLLAGAMVVTGLVVIGVQMELVRQGPTGQFWSEMGPAVFMTLVLFAAFYGLAVRFRTRRDLHKRFMLLAGTGALGAAGFRVLAQVVGFGPLAGIGGILMPNLIIVAAVLVETRRGDGVHPVYRWGLPASVLLEAAAFLLVTTVPGQWLAAGLAWVGRVLAPLY
jgi:hypothetical protein